MRSHPLNAVVSKTTLPSDDVEGFGLCRIEGVNHTHQVGVVAQPLKMTLEV